MRSKTKGVVLSTFFLFFLVFAGWAQPIPDTIRIAVTYYDFHSNASCPDFNPPDSKDYVTKNMVQTTLDSTGRPVRGSRVYFSQYIENWFRPWSEHVIKNRKPTYNLAGGDPNTSTTHGTMLSEKQVEYDTVYKNITIEDSLTFKHIGAGVYEYKNAAFFPLDNKGFKKEPTVSYNGAVVQDHNYSFSLMIERQFLYRKGLKFRFEGDDDVWVFIDNKLVMDIGGIHMSSIDSFALDNIAGSLGLILNQRYKLTFLFCERQANECHIWITTNLIYAPPNQLKLIVQPNDTIRAGDTVTGKAEVWSDTGKVLNYPGKITWHWYDLPGMAHNHDSTFKHINDTTVQFIPTEAHGIVRIAGRYDYDTTHFGDSVLITVIPNDPAYCVIEATPDKPPYAPIPEAPLWDSWPRDSIIIPAGVISNEDFYAILRDRYGNWIGPGNPITWASANDNLMRAETGTDPAKGQGRAVRLDWSKHASTRAIGTYNFNGKDLWGDVVIHLDAETYKVASACYIDTNNRPDGYIDLVKVRLNKSFLQLTDEIVQKFIDNSPKDMLPLHRYFTLSNTKIIANNEFYIYVRQNIGSVGDPVTSVDSKDIFKVGSFTINDVGFVEGTVTQIDDSLGAVITRAEYRPGFIKNEAQTVRDTLKVFFSETVRKPQSEVPFRYYDLKNKKEYEMGLDNTLSPDEGTMMRFYKKWCEKGAPENGDSICIKAAKDLPENSGGIKFGAVEDVKGVYYPDRATKWQPMVVYPAKYMIKITVSGPDLNIPPVMKENLSNLINNSTTTDKVNVDKGIVLVIKPVVNQGSTINFENVLAFLTVYDPLGNIVVKDKKSVFDPNKKVFLIYWNAKNLYGRDVGNFIYIGFVTIEGPGVIGEGPQKVFIGVKR